MVSQQTGLMGTAGTFSPRDDSHTGADVFRSSYCSLHQENLTSKVNYDLSKAIKLFMMIWGHVYLSWTAIRAYFC
jgi:hypothetical protein